MKVSKIQELLRLVAESGVSEVEIEEDDFKLTIRQNSPQVVMQPAQAGYAAPPPQQPVQAPQQPPPHQSPSPGGAPAGNPSAPDPAPQTSSSDDANQDAASTAGTSSQEPPENGTADADEEAIQGYEVPAPIVGTFYRAPSPDADPFVEEGDHVSEGDVLCIIEAMKLMNEIECETSGTITEILVDDAEPVEFDQTLFVIEED